MGRKVDLLRNYPKTTRDPSARVKEKTEADREIARKFDIDFFDGERRHGYGGFYYNEKYWSPVVPDFEAEYGPLSGKRILDVGCAKGFMLFDFKRLIPDVVITGIDISEYAIAQALPEVRDSLSVANAKELPFEDESFDLVISINTVHNLDLKECKCAIKEISRVGKGRSFITVDSYSNDDERERMFAWNLTAKTILSNSDWISLFDEVGYKGDFGWFTP